MTGRTYREVHEVPAYGSLAKIRQERGVNGGCSACSPVLIRIGGCILTRERKHNLVQYQLGLGASRRAEVSQDPREGEGHC